LFQFIPLAAGGVDFLENDYLEVKIRDDALCDLINRRIAARASIVPPIRRTVRSEKFEVVARDLDAFSVGTLGGRLLCEALSRSDDKR
jgi:hypothetical protein